MKKLLAVILSVTMLCMIAAMNDMSVPAVSLEGKSLWIPQSLPVPTRTVLRVKLNVQLLLSGIPALFAAVCAALITDASPAVRLAVAVTPPAFAAFAAVAGTLIGVRMPLLTWTSETAPLKQSGAVAIALFGGWAVCIALAGLYLAFGYLIGAAAYLGLWSALFAAAALLLLRRLDTKGADAFAAL